MQALAAIDRERRSRLMAALDRVNAGFGQHTLYLAVSASAGLVDQVRAEVAHLHDQWDEVPKAAA